MKRIWLVEIIIIIMFSLSAFAQDTNEVEKLNWYPVLKDALESGMLTVQDITVKRDYVTPDPFRLKIGIDWLEKPFLIPSETQKIANEFKELKSVSSLFDVISRLKDNPTSEFSFTISDFFPDSSEKLLSKLESINPDMKEARGDVSARLMQAIQKLPDQVIMALCPLIEGAETAKIEGDKAYAQMKPEDVKFLMENISRITTEGQEADEETTKRLYALSKQVKQQHIANSAKIIFSCLYFARGTLIEFKASPAHEAEDNEIIFEMNTVNGKIIVGGYGKNVYKENAFIIIDLGGNDEYRGKSCSITDRLNGTSIIIDLSGNDLYHTDESYALASAIGGYAVILDENGDDSYTGAHHVQGCGTFGLGLLIDAKGIDHYVADTGSQGAGYWGYGILIDYEGNDYYTAYLNSQAYAQVSGAGFLLDFAGNDTYSAGGKYKDFREGQKYYGSLSQGFAIGARPDYSAGIGGLFDFGGNDNYIADYFAQGSSYWFGVGILYDEAGDDRYIARRYSQGSGIHLSTGALIDMGGNDMYIAWGVSQGCGHDISQGILFDAAGNDYYHSSWLSQGAGNANGFGIFIDLDGNDRYFADGPNSQGAGVYTKKETTFSRARGYTSIGVLIDGNGKDTYNCGGEDNTFWRGEYFGVGYDTAKPAAPEQKGGNAK